MFKWSNGCKLNDSNPKVETISKRVYCVFDNKISDEEYVRYTERLECIEDDCYNCITEDKLDFNGFCDFLRPFSFVVLKKKDWCQSRCTCKTFFKEYICEHIVMISLKYGGLVIPEDVNIGQKPKRGRPAKADKAALVKQKTSHLK